MPIDRQMRPCAGGHRKIVTKDGPSTIDRHVLEEHVPAGAPFQHGAAAGRMDVANPVGVGTEHRDQVVLAVVLHQDEGECDRLSRLLPRTCSVTASVGDSSALEYCRAPNRFICRASQFGCPPRYNQRLTGYSHWKLR